MRICINELRHCQEISPKPNFLIMIGSRYGWIPLPELIDAKDAARLLKYADKEEYDLFSQRYFLNENYTDPAYEIVPDNESGLLPKDTDSKLHALFRKYVEKSSDSCFYKTYCLSATHQEILEGAFITDDISKHLIFYSRSLNGIPEEFQPTYLENNEQSRIDSLKKEIAGIAAPQNIYHADIDYKDYISERFRNTFAEEMYERIISIVETEIREQESLKGIQEHLLIQQAFIEDNESNFISRHSEINFLQYFISDKNDKSVCILKSPDGYGKTSLLAHLCSLSADANCFCYFIGLSPYTLTGYEILKLMLAQLGVSFNNYETGRDLSRKLKCALSCIENPIVVIVDGLDNLRNDDEFLDMSWLLAEFPRSLKMIISCNGKQEGVERVLSKYPHDLLILPPLTNGELIRIFEKRIGKVNRRVTDKQLEVVGRLFEKCDNDTTLLPLLYEITQNWRSEDKPSIQIENAQQLMNLYISWLGKSENNDREFIRIALGSLCLTRNGATEDEILRIAAIDRKYLDRLISSSFHKLKIQDDTELRIPYTIWSKLYFCINSFLLENRTGSKVTYCFTNRKIKETIRSGLKTIYGDFDDIYGYIEKYFEKDLNFSTARTVEELPYLYLQHREYEKLIQLLTNPDFIHSKSKKGYVDELYSDITDSINSLPAEYSEGKERLEIIRSFILQKRSIIIKYAPLGLSVRKQLEKFQQEYLEKSPSDTGLRLLWSVVDSNLKASVIKDSFALVCNYCKGDSNSSYSTCSLWDLESNTLLKWIDIPMTVESSGDSYFTGRLTLATISHNADYVWLYDDYGVLWEWQIKSNSLVSYKIGHVMDLYADHSRLMVLTHDALFALSEGDLSKIIDNVLEYGNFSNLYKNQKTHHFYILGNHRHYLDLDENNGSVSQRSLSVNDELIMLAYNESSDRICYRCTDETTVYSESLSAESNLETYDGFKTPIFSAFVDDRMHFFIWSENRKIWIYNLKENTLAGSFNPANPSPVIRIGPAGKPDRFYIVSENALALYTCR